jgi:branched-chain amino acid transport system substrate-binding protein
MNINNIKSAPCLLALKRRGFTVLSGKIAQKLFNLSWLGLSLMLLMSCNQSYDASKQQRMQRAANPKKDQPIVIGIPWTNTPDDDFIKGVKLAVEEINHEGGVLNGVPLAIIINDSESAYYDTDLSQGARQNVILNIANAYAANLDLIAVIGHSSSETAMIASVIYQNRGVLFLAPNAEDVKLTGHNFDYTFRTTLNNEIMGTQLAEFAGQKGYKRIGMLYARTNSTEEFIDAFTTRAVEKYATDIVYRRSFFESDVDIISLAAELKSIQKLDAICIAASGKKAAEIYRQLRDMGIKQPIIGNTALDSTEMLNLLKQWEYSKKAKESSIPTLYDSSIPRAKQFENQFKQKYGQETTYLAALGYDSVNLLAHGIQYAKSRVPLEIATTLRYMDACKGVTGKFQFKLNGDLQSKPVSFYHIDKQDYIFEQVNNGEVIDPPNMEICNEVDRDHDGIPTSSDVCPDTTAAEIAKGVNLDGAERGCPIDGDNDEIANYKDDCPTDTVEAISKGIDAKGCPVDYDKDAIPDYKDDDIDGDNVANTIDTCPKSTFDELKFGANPTGKQAGCPVDSDSDLVLDYLDSCRTNTADEISQGVDAKGCPVDKDTDGVLDYMDKCLKSSTDFLLDEQGCEVVVSTTTLKSASLLFAPRQSKLTKAGEKYLDGLLVTHSNLQVLKKIEIIGYAAIRDIPLYQSRLQSIASYLQQKDMPVEKIEASVKESEAKKNNAVEVIFSEVKLSSDEAEIPSEPEADKVDISAKPEADKVDISAKPEAGKVDISAKPEADKVVTPAKRKTGKVDTPTKPKSKTVKPQTQPKSSTPSTRPTH